MIRTGSARFRKQTLRSLCRRSKPQHQHFPTGVTGRLANAPIDGALAGDVTVSGPLSNPASGLSLVSTSLLNTQR